MWYGKKVVKDNNGYESVIVDDGHGNIVYKDLLEYDNLVKMGKATPPRNQLKLEPDPQSQLH